MTPRARLVIADDHPLVCSGLKTLLEPAYEVVATVQDGKDVMGTVARYAPDVVMMDLSLPGQNGLVLSRELKAQGERPKVVVVTMHADRVYVDEALRAGVDGYLLKTAKAAELRHALSEVLAGRRYVSPVLRRAQASPPGLAADIGEPLDGENTGLAQLTERQREVLLLVGQGNSNQEIAARLGITLKAIEYHRARIRRVLAITSRAGLYRFATRYAERWDRKEKT